MALATSVAEKSTSPQSSPIELARQYVQERVQLPALASDLPDVFKSKIRHSDHWLQKFKHVGDLLIYLQRFEIDDQDPIYRAMKSFGLLTFEDIVDDFKKRFAQWSLDCSRPTDFVVGEMYPVHDILILARNYDTRSGGMFVLEANGEPALVIIKANLADGPYPNEWIVEPAILKYYLKSISGIFGEHFKANRAILDNKAIPILTFTRADNSEPLVCRGIFHYRDIVRDETGSKAFVLAKATSAKLLSSSAYVSNVLNAAVWSSTLDSRQARLNRLEAAPKYPRKIVVTSTAFERNPDVIAEVLFRAAGMCESCGSAAPFLRLSDGTPYLEVHHVQPLAKGGADTVANAIALCPNCHRMKHYGPDNAVAIPRLNDNDLSVTI